MPRKKRPFVATPDEVSITRDGDFAIIRYEDETIETTQYRIGRESLSRLTDGDILAMWNAGLATAQEEAAKSRRDMSALLQGGNTLECTIESYPAAPNQPFIKVAGRLYTAMELAHLLGGHVGWELKIELRSPRESIIG